MIEAAGIISSLLGVYLSSQRKRSAWVMNIIASGIYVYFFYTNGLYSDMELQGIFILMALYGYYQWNQVENGWKPSKNRLIENILGLLLAGLYGLIAGYLHIHYMHQTKTPYWDATLTGMSILSTYWAAQRKIENWILWIFVDIAYVGMYLVNGLIGTAALYSVFIILAIRGWFSWHKELKIN